MDARVFRWVATPLVGVGSHRRTGEHGEKALMTHWKHLVVALVAAFALAACSSSSDNGGTTSTETETSTTAEQTPAERQMTLIESAQSGLEMALSALDADDPTADRIEAVRDAMTLLESALAGAVDLSPNQTMEARDDLADARDAAREAQTTLDTGIATAGRVRMQMMDISDAQGDLADALEGDAIADLAAANSAYDDLEEAIEDGSDLTDAQKAMAVSDLNAADVAIARAEMSKYDADAMADGATDAQMLAAYQGKLKAARRLAAADAASPDDRATANMAIGEATAKIAQLEDDIQDAVDDRNNKQRLADNAASMKVAEAINDHTVPGDTPMVFEIDSTDLATDPDFTISRSSGAAKLTLGQTTAQKRDKPYTSSSAPSAGTGWMGTSFSHSGTSGKRPFTEMAAVYTDIEMAGPVVWTQAALTGIADVTLATVVENGAVTITAGDSVAAIRFGSSGILPSKPTDDDTGTERAFSGPTSHSGTLFGVSGLFVCSAACTVERNITADDVDTVTVTTGSVTFTPSGSVPAGGRMAKYADPDTDYTYFGYWMKSTTLRDGTMEHDIETFHGGMTSVADLGVDGTTPGTAGTATVLGTAKYYGAAAGVYVKKDGTGDSLAVTDGNFTADAMLTARFGGPSIAVDDNYEVEGVISDFMDGSADLGFADLMLGASHIANNGAISVGETNGGGTSGDWSGRFFGNAGADTTTGTDPDADDFPLNVSGQFNGHFVNGHVAGAFGAEYDE